MIMIFFMAMPFIIGLMNLVVPLQIGARDVAFPFLNSLSFWLSVVRRGAGQPVAGRRRIRRTGWVAYPPLSGLRYSPGVGVDYYIWALQISGIGTTLTGVNFIVTILKMRAPGMTLMKHADLHLDCAGHQHPDRRRLPDPDRYPGAADRSTATSASTSSPTNWAAIQ